ncbi:Mitotic spindle assembly checkpoint protein [Phytophthora cinnamomi]|uniref:Mitotic spindle assembly checkpoint protein n=1 Tax=Phytophthora cinnamomi TaxID=4785 RepID=UPI00355942BF|nr:Mitotic spindle assembly checkpoint protein [Phytophthora cinnamomi]
MTTDSPESSPARSRVEEEDATQEFSQPVVEDAASPPFAFAAWKAQLELMLQREAELVHESVQALLGDFDDRSQFVRGDFAWRKQLVAFHERLQDMLTNQLGILAANVSKHAAQVAESLAQTLAKAERDGQRAVHKQEQKGDLALRRARAALAKEVDRTARLEKCLRLEEARQAAAILAERERQLTAEHNERESHLQALLSEMRSSNESLETLNSQLLEALRTSRGELDQMRNTLVRCMSRPKRRVSSSTLPGESKSVESAPRQSGEKSGKNSTTRGMDSLPSTANELLLVPSLRQSLSAATQTVANLKARVSELENTRDSDKHRLQELQLALAQAENEKLKATKLLSEARSALIDNENKLVEAANESVRWQDKFDRLQALAQGRERALADSQRLENATRDQLALLTSRLERVLTIEAQWCDFEHAVAKWKENQQGQLGDLESIVESFLRLDESDKTKPTELVPTEAQKDIEIRLRLLDQANQLEDTVGSDGVFEILHRRRHRKQHFQMASE